jgi:broad specificity phosphatase PhoE
MAMLAELMGMPRESTWSFAVANTSVTRLQFGRSGRVMLTGFNDHAHTLDLRAEESAKRKLDLVEDSAATRTA